MHIINITAKNIYEAGLIFGKEHKALILKHLNFIKKILPKKFNVPWNYHLIYANKLQKYANLKTKNAWRYLCGLAKGSGADFEELFALNSYDLLDNGHISLYEPQKSLKHCTTILYKEKKDSWLAFNEEWDSRFLPYLTLLKVKLPKVSFFALGFPAEIPGYSTGANSLGLIYACNSLTLNKDTYGLPLPFILFDLHFDKTSRTFLKKLKNIRTGSSVNINFLEAKRITTAECRNDGEQFIISKETGYLIHTNHTLQDSIFSGTERFLTIRAEATEARLKRVMKILESKKITQPKDAFKFLLLDDFGRYKIYNSQVLASCVYDFKSKTLKIIPRKEKPLVISL